MNEILESLSVLISESYWFAPFIALIAGLLTSLTPCSLSTIPLVIGVVGGMGNRDTRKAFRLSLVFAFGTAVTFTVLGTLASLAGELIGTSYKWWYIALGVLMVLMSLQIWEIFNFIPSTYLISKSTKKGYLGALLAGILGGIFSSPCSTPVLIVLIAIVAGKANLVWGILLFLFYSAGHAVLAVAAGTSLGLVQKITKNEKYGKISFIIKIILGLAILLIAFYMFYLGL